MRLQVTVAGVLENSCQKAWFLNIMPCSLGSFGAAGRAVRARSRLMFPYLLSDKTQRTQVPKLLADN